MRVLWCRYLVALDHRDASIRVMRHQLRVRTAASGVQPLPTPSGSNTGLGGVLRESASVLVQVSVPSVTHAAQFGRDNGLDDVPLLEHGGGGARRDGASAGGAAHSSVDLLCVARACVHTCAPYPPLHSQVAPHTMPPGATPSRHLTRPSLLRDRCDRYAYTATTASGVDAEAAAMVAGKPAEALCGGGHRVSVWAVGRGTTEVPANRLDSRLTRAQDTAATVAFRRFVGVSSVIDATRLAGVGAAAWRRTRVESLLQRVLEVRLKTAVLRRVDAWSDMTAGHTSRVGVSLQLMASVRDEAAEEAAVLGALRAVFDAVVLYVGVVAKWW